MTIPDNLKYAKSHEWIRMDGNTATSGISDYAQGELGDVVFVDITASVDDKLSAGSSFGTIEAVKTVSDVYVPVDGRIVEINPAITDDPEIINKDPYGDGWMVKVEVADGADMSALLDAAAYLEMVGA